MGPVIGGVLIGFLASGLRDIFQYWEVVVALVFIVVVLRFPGGIAQLINHISPPRFRNSTVVARKRTNSLVSAKLQVTPNLKFDHVA